MWQGNTKLCHIAVQASDGCTYTCKVHPSPVHQCTGKRSLDAWNRPMLWRPGMWSKRQCSL